MSAQSGHYPGGSVHDARHAGNVMRENPQYVPVDEFMRQLKAKAVSS